MLATPGPASPGLPTDRWAGHVRCSCPFYEIGRDTIHGTCQAPAWTNDPRPKALLILGDVNFDANSLLAQADTQTHSRPAWMRRSAPRSDESGWSSLPGFQQELAILRDQFEKQFDGGVTTLRGAKATEAA